MCHTINNEKEAKELLNLTVKIGRNMLAYGAEVYRVEDTIHRICKSYTNIKAANALVTYNFVIVSFIYDDTNYTTMRRAIVGDKNLEKISLINDLSRKIVSGCCTIEESYGKLKAIKTREEYPAWAMLLALVISGPFFAIMFDGTLKDSIYAMLVMLIEGMFLIYATKFKIMYFLKNFLGAFFATILVNVASHYFLIVNPSSIIIVSLMPLVPGVQVTNAVRDFMAGDYISGMIGIQAAIFVSTAIALGVVFGLKIT